MISLISSIVACLSNARQYEGVMVQCFDKIAQEFAAPDEPLEKRPDPQLLAIQIQSQRNAWDYEIKKEQNEIKKTELMLKKQQDDAKNVLALNELNVQMTEKAK